MKLVKAEEFAALLRDRSREIGLSGAALARHLGVGPSQGANLTSGRQTTTLSNMLKWAGAVGLDVNMMVSATTAQVEVRRLLESMASVPSAGLKRVSVFLADDIDLLLKASDLPRSRLKLLREFLFILRYCSDSDLKVWEYQLAAHVEDIHAGMAPRSEKHLADNGGG